MKLRFLLAAGFAGLALSLMAQTHEEGIEYYKADQLSNALELLNRNLNNPGTDKALSYYYLGQIEMDRNKPAEARKYFDQGIQADPECAYNYVGLGYVTLKGGDVKGAEKYFKEAESKAKKDRSVMVDIARAYYNADPVLYKDKYEKKIDEVLKKDSSNSDVYILQGDISRDEAYNTGNTKAYGTAAAKYDMATANDPTSAVAYVKYADMYSNANNPGFAISKLEELLRNNPNSALGQRQLANAYYENGDFTNAAKQYGAYVKNPNHFKEDEDRYAFILFYDGKYKDAYDYASKLIQENPNNFSARRYQFMNAAQMPEMGDALLPMAETLLSMNRANPTTNKFAPIDYNLISDELVTAGRFDDAVAVLNDALKAYPTNTNFSSKIATVYVAAKDYGKAADVYTDYLKTLDNPTYADLLQEALYAYLGGLQYKDDVVNEQDGTVIRPKDLTLSQKYLATAADYANRAFQADQTQYRPKKVLGDIAIAGATQENRNTVAQPMYEEALAVLEANPVNGSENDEKAIYNYLGYYYYEKRDNAKAKEYFNKSLEIDPSNTQLRKFVDGIK